MYFIATRPLTTGDSKDYQFDVNPSGPIPIIFAESNKSAELNMHTSRGKAEDDNGNQLFFEVKDYLPTSSAPPTEAVTVPQPEPVPMAP
jgi:hypothetical protein